MSNKCIIINHRETPEDRRECHTGTIHIWKIIIIIVVVIIIIIISIFVVGLYQTAAERPGFSIQLLWPQVSEKSHDRENWKSMQIRNLAWR